MATSDSRKKRSKPKDRRLRKKRKDGAPPPAAGLWLFGSTKRSAVHPDTKKKSSGVLRVTPSQIDGPMHGAHVRIIIIFFLPLLIAVLTGAAFQRDSSEEERMAPEEPFAAVAVTSSKVIYIPKSTGIQFERPEAQALVQSNISYGRQEVRFNIGSESRSNQLLYVFALIGVEREATDNATYEYTQHVQASVSTFTEDGLGEIEISKDYELSRKITCEAYMKWCRKIRVGVVHELNLPVYEARVRFTRPPNNDLADPGDPVPLNDTIPIVGEIRIEYIPASYTGFECATRYGFNLVSMGVLFWPKTGLFATLLARPIEDWTSERLWALLLFWALFWYNEPLWAMMVWAPDQQLALRSFHATTATGAVAAYLGFAAFSIFKVKYKDDRPPALLIWVRERRERKLGGAAEEDVEEDTGGTHPAEAAPSSILSFPMFAVTTVAESSSTRRVGRRAGKLVTIDQSGLWTFTLDAARRCLRGMADWRTNRPSPTSWQQIWGPVAITILTILLWVFPNELYQAQLSKGAVQRPRLTMPYALVKHEEEMRDVVAAAICYSILLLGSALHVSSELCMTIKPYAVFYGVTILLGLLLILGTLNASFYPLGTPLMEALVARVALNTYAWVVAMMVTPLRSTEGILVKRYGKATAAADRGSSDDDDDNNDDDDDDDESSSSSTSEEDEDSDGGGGDSDG